MGWVPKPGEIEWDQEQRALVIAYRRVERNTGRFGEWLPDATNPGADPNKYENPLRYYSHGPFTNWAEKTARDAEEAWKKEAGDRPNMNGMFWTVDTEPPTSPEQA